ncbi:NAD-dependent epimerase/dehydratase family protein [Endozoicomonas ascidiicola]|uniref:NAD-dependent epimerase/dehydratase family protein n=1 Tax=Endozoicomonas ascidiicola TaxID=1698521 RepID=UPI0008364F9B|nr:NAD-dependent epimerase/dehydratase family protein [Endozoicomonas ascidiicola]
MKALVTGGSGFLGINLIKQLLDKHWEVIATHRASSNIKDLQALNVTLLEVDLESPSDLSAKIPEGLDAIFHVAGDTSLWAANNERQHRMNVTVTENLITAALEKRVKRFIHTSSISAYGFHQQTINESSPSSAITSGVNYLRTKYLGEMVVKKAVKEHQLDAVILNPCAIIGPHDRQSWAQLFSMISNDTLPGVPPGEGSYCHVREVAAAHIAAFEQGKTGENYILGGVDCKFLEVVNTISRLMGKPERKRTIPAWALRLLGKVSDLGANITGKEPEITTEKAKLVSKRVVASSSKAVSELGYRNDVPINEMLEDCFDWLKQEQLV